MKNQKLSDSEIRLLIYFLALLIFAGAYFLVFQRFSKEAQAIEDENAANQIVLQNYQTMALRQGDIEKETKEAKASIDEIIAKYPSDMTTEKAIMIVQDVENMTGIEITNIGFLMDNLLGNVVEVTAAEVAQENASAQIVEETSDQEQVSGDSITLNEAGKNGYYAALSMNYEAEYDAWKNMVVYINELKDRITIPAISASYDNASGKISGVVTINMYYLTNTGRSYEAPAIDEVLYGVGDIFTSSAASFSEKVEEITEEGNTSEEVQEDSTAEVTTSEETTNE